MQRSSGTATGTAAAEGPRFGTELLEVGTATIQMGKTNLKSRMTFYKGENMP